MKFFLWMWLIIFPALVFSAEDSMVLTADQWARPHDAVSVLQLPAVANAVQALNSQPDSSQLVIRYPQGETGSMWAQQLHDWLVTLGIGSDRLLLLPANSKDNIKLELRTVVQID